ncbi:MAG: DNA mismatch endonuclease Vsr [Pyrinomonadaceae bacterium]|nr:DNA mismatch endonuclease Vsr [Pyrinomonadaceae bacterium]
MTDMFSKEKRSWIMGRVRGGDTKPEIQVRSIIHRMGFRFRLHRRELPGKPDIVLPRHGKVIFVHGCFWHGHKRCTRSKRPTTNMGFWNRKLDMNIKRDKISQRKLRSKGWKVMVVWQCETRRPRKLLGKFEKFLYAD